MASDIHNTCKTRTAQEIRSYPQAAFSHTAPYKVQLGDDHHMGQDDHASHWNGSVSILVTLPPFGDPGSKHVLVMDDNVDILEIFGQLLRDESYAVTLSTTLLDPLTVAKLAPDVIITDIVFDGKDASVAAISDLQNNTQTQDIPIICCTLFGSRLEDSAHAHLPLLAKPFDLEDVLAAIDQTDQNSKTCDSPPRS